MSKTLEATIDIDASPQAVWSVVSDLQRMGEWSPQCTGCVWDEGEGPAVGSHFTGTNEAPGRTWQTRSTVIAADPGREFAWEVGEGFVRWEYRLEAGAGGATTLTESWEFCEAGLEYFAEKFGDTAGAEIAVRTRAAHEGIPATLAAIKQVAEQPSA